MTPEPRKSRYIQAMILYFQSSPAEQRRLVEELEEAVAQHRAKLRAQATVRKRVASK